MPPFTYRLHHEPFRKPSRNEEAYFRRQEFLDRMARARRSARAREARERERLRTLHQGRCPRCGERLEHIRVRNAWADQCPVCEGVWLDRDVFCLLTHRKQQPLADVFRYLLVDQCLGEMHAD